MTAPRSYFGRLAAASALVAAGAAACAGLAASRAAESHMVDQLTEGLYAQARLLAAGMPAADSGLNAWAGSASGLVGARVTFIDAGGRVRGDSAVEPEGLENHATRPEVAAALAGRPGRDIRMSHSTGRDYLYAALPAGGGALRLALPLTDVARGAALRRSVAAASFAAGLAALALAGFAAWRVHRPMAELARAADRMGAGDFSVRADPSAPGEFGRLAALLNRLAERVGSTLAALAADTARLEATLAHMEEGVALVGGNGRIETLNPAMEGLFGAGADEARGLAFGEVLRHPPLAALVQSARDSGLAKSGEVTLFTPAERIFSAHATPVTEPDRAGGTVLVLHEITRLRTLEDLRKEFVANVSHELRTPVASIKSFAETLRRGALEDPEVRVEFVRTIEEQADRLILLVDDLLELAAIEGGRRPMDASSIALSEPVESVLAALKPLAASAGVALTASIPAGLSVRADAGGLERVLRNLVENAVKYNRPGGSVTVGARAEGGSVLLSVSDTGLGIPAGDLPRVFERFYRVDKARSRELGGTGLGLSIVKHLCESMGGSVGAQSVEGKGSTFTAELPAA